jgi:hypothetical protein
MMMDAVWGGGVLSQGRFPFGCIIGRDTAAPSVLVAWGGVGGRGGGVGGSYNPFRIPKSLLDPQVHVLGWNF